MRYILLSLGCAIYLIAFYTGQQGMYAEGFKAGQYSIVLTALNNGQLVASR